LRPPENQTFDTVLHGRLGDKDHGHHHPDLVARRVSFVHATRAGRTYNDLAPWNYAELPNDLGCGDWYVARVTTVGELDNALKAARASKTAAYIEIIVDKMDMPPRPRITLPEYPDANLPAAGPTAHELLQHFDSNIRCKSLQVTVSGHLLACYRHT
jgi:hypothetical protein